VSEQAQQAGRLLGEHKWPQDLVSFGGVGRELRRDKVEVELGLGGGTGDEGGFPQTILWAAFQSAF
jgi:hypothetical protein